MDEKTRRIINPEPGLFDQMESDEGWIRDLKMVFGFVWPALLLIGGAGAFLFALFKFAG